ncbi:TerB family tellurite resistance protein [Pelagibius marinus]|uniref:TerB family tellurite resistance protein n=1 Tax=Pelagibius marinus TaxID=2762760 RepID=UPI0018721F37|nr:TerB family tellurite resistance protein [Pelagibius marinus]
MHIVLAVLGIAAGIGIWLWRAHMAARAAGELMETADDIRAALRRFGYRRKANVSPLDGIDDARLAAAGILAAFANMEGGIGRAEIEAICEECRRAFKTDSAEAAQIGAYGRWLVQQSANMDEAVRRLARNLEGKLDEAEKGQLLEMIERVASIDDGALTDGQRYTLAQLARQLS